MPRKAKRREYGSGGVSQRADETWLINWRDRHGRHQKSGFATRAEAEAVLTRVLAVKTESTDTPDDDRPPLGDLFIAWCNHRRSFRRSIPTQEKRWRKHIGPIVDKLKPHQLTADHVKEVAVTATQNGCAPGTVKCLVQLMSTFLSDLMDDGKVTTNVAKNLKRSVKELTKSEFDSSHVPFIKKLDDVKRIQAALPFPASLAYALGSLLGLRIGEIRAMTWSRISLENRTVEVLESMNDANVVRSPKSKRGRTLIIGNYLFGILTEAYATRDARKKYVCPGLKNGAIGTRSLNAALQKVLKELGLQVDGLLWHEATRHTYASHYVITGGSIIKLRDALGHSSVVTTERYSHLLMDHSETERQRFG